MINVIGIIGQSGSGKNYIQQSLLNEFPQIRRVVMDTTRPARENEENGVDYNFISSTEYDKNLENNNYITNTPFRDWNYGLNKNAFSENELNILTLNLEQARILQNDKNINLFTIFVYASDKTRLQRSLSRENQVDCAEVCRRFLADREDFSKTEDVHVDGVVLNDPAIFGQDRCALITDNIRRSINFMLEQNKV